MIYYGMVCLAAPKFYENGKMMITGVIQWTNKVSTPLNMRNSRLNMTMDMIYSVFE